MLPLVRVAVALVSLHSRALFVPTVINTYGRLSFLQPAVIWDIQDQGSSPMWKWQGHSQVGTLKIPSLCGLTFPSFL